MTLYASDWGAIEPPDVYDNDDDEDDGEGWDEDAWSDMMHDR